MINRQYQKRCDVERLTQELITSGKPVYPTAGARFYGINCDEISGNYVTTIMLYDDITQQETDAIDVLVTNHIPIPLPEPVPFLKDADGKLWTKTESRPLSCTTVFTCSGDIIGATPSIGTGARMQWDASVDTFITDGCPSGYKKKSVEIQFCDSVWIKEGTIYYLSALKNSYIDLELICPNGGYYMYLGQVCQNTTGNDLVVDHYVCKHPCQGDVPMGDELNTETCSQEMPNYLKVRMTITVPVADVLSYGYVEVELYRQRSVVL